MAGVRCYCLSSLPRKPDEGKRWYDLPAEEQRELLPCPNYGTQLCLCLIVDARGQ